MSNTVHEPSPQPLTKKPRLPRYQRVKDPPRMVLTERDREILRQVYLFRLLTREQIERLLFPPDNGQDHSTKTSKARKRLKLLYHHGYLERIPVPVGQGLWAWRPVYRLGRKGAKLIAAELGSTVRKLDYWGKSDDADHRHSEVSLLFVHHTLAINDVRIAITLASMAKGYQLEQWIDETQLKRDEMKDYVSVIAGNGHGARVPVIPDAYFALHLGDRRAHFFLELDRATMSTKRWKTRIRAYRAYADSGKYQARYKTRSLRVLTVTTTPQRLESLRQTTFQAGGGDLFWFTTIGEVTANTVLNVPIWRLANDASDGMRNPLIA
jgi:Replication-relaxation